MAIFPFLKSVCLDMAVLATKYIVLVLISK